MREIITSLQNEKIKQAVKLKEGKERKKTNFFLVEGGRELSLAIAGGVEVERVFHCPDFGGNAPEGLSEKTIVVSKKVFEKISYRENPDGLLAIARGQNKKMEDLNVGKSPTIVVMEGLEKPGNIGAILRTCDAAGVDAVLICGEKTDLYNHNIIRASQGTVFTNNVAVASVDDILSWLKKKKVKIFVSDPRAKKVYTKAELKGSVAIVVGAEDKGLTDKWLVGAGENIRIEMKGKIDSLNASVSLAVILLEAVRQKSGA